MENKKYKKHSSNTSILCHIDNRLIKEIIFDKLININDCWDFLENKLQIKDIHTLMLVCFKMYNFIEKTYTNKYGNLWMGQLQTFIIRNITSFEFTNISPYKLSILLVGIPCDEIKSKLVDICIKNNIEKLDIVLANKGEQKLGSTKYRTEKGLIFLEINTLVDANWNISINRYNY